MFRNWLRHGYNKVAKLGAKEKFGVLESHPAAKRHAEEAMEAHGEIQIKIKFNHKEFQIYRWNPEYPNHKPFLRSFFIDISKCGPMVHSSLLFSLFVFDASLHLCV